MTELTNRAIAEALGFRAEQYIVTAKGHHPHDVGKTFWRLIDPQGRDVNWHKMFQFEVWEHSSNLWNGLPDYLHDANAALALWDDEPCWIETGRPVNSVGFFCLVRGHSPRHNTDFYTTAILRAEAIARCWWAYKHAQ